MKTLVLTIIAVALASAAFAFSPNGSKVTILAVTTTNQNLANDKEYMVDTPTACQMRLKRNSSVSNGSVTAIKLRANTTYTFEVNPSTPFANLSGCTSATLARK